MEGMRLSKEMLRGLGDEVVYVIRRHVDDDHDQGEFMTAGVAQRLRNFAMLADLKHLVPVPKSLIKSEGRGCGTCRRAFESEAAVRMHHERRHSAHALAEAERQRKRDEADEEGRRQGRSSTSRRCVPAGAAGHPCVRSTD